MSANGGKNIGGSEGMLPQENFEFLDSLERSFTYIRRRFEEKLQPQKAIFKSPNVVRAKKYFCETSSSTHK